MTKVAGRAASYAPSQSQAISLLGSGISALALGSALVLGASQAHAGNCNVTSPGAGNWECVDQVGPGDQTQFISGGGNALTVSTLNGFGLDVAGSGTGIRLSNGGADITFTDNVNSSISGGLTGISANMGSGSGNTVIVSTGSVEATIPFSGNGIDIDATNNDGNIDLTVNDVIGGGDGIEIGKTGGSGDVTVTATGNVTGTAATGIEVGMGANPFFGTAAPSGDVKIITEGEVIGGFVGIGVSHGGEGLVDIEAAGETFGGGYGIVVDHTGVNGGVSIEATADVTGETIDGISAAISDAGNAGDIEITAQNVTGAQAGIDASTSGTGNVNIEATGYVEGLLSANGTGQGISASIYNTNSSGNVEVNADEVLGGTHGIYGYNAGSGDLTINTTGNVTGENYNGIFAVSGGSEIDLTVSSDPAGGSISAVTGGSFGAGINTSTGIGGHTTITLNAGTEVSATSGVAISNDLGDTDIFANVGSIVTGNILLGGGADNLNFEGGDFSNVTLFDGGDGFDKLAFNGSSGALDSTDAINWETVTIGGNSEINLSSGSLDAGLVAIGMSGTLTGFDGFTLTGDLANLGALSMQDDDASDLIVVEGDYLGGGDLYVDVDFTADVADVLEIEGSVSDATWVNVGDVSSGLATGNDVLVVDVAGATDAGDFVLVGGPVSSGAYAYDLGLENGSQWYLQNAGMNQTSATYDAASSILLGFAELPTLEQRVGQRQWLSIEDEQVSLAPKEGLWLRFEGDKLNYNAGNSASGYQYDRQSWGAQVGWDYSVEERDSGYWVLGLTAQYGTMDSSVTNDFGSGSIDAEGFGIGATGTWYGNNGTYFDAQAQINWLDSDYGSSAAGTLISGQSATAYALGVEVGHRFELDGQRNLIPQAQIMWGQLDSDGFTDSAGNAVGFSSANSLIGRLGLAYEYEHSEGKLSDDGTSDTESLGQSEKTYVIGNVLHQFSDTAFSMNGDNFESGDDTTWAEVGLGGSISWDDEGSLFVEGSYRTSLGGDSKGSDGWGLSAGYRMSW